MNIIDLEQNTPEWLEWRKGKIGSSTIPIILGVSPWKTVRRLYLEETGQIEAVNTSNFATERGHRWEPKIRAIYELRTGKEFPARCAEHLEQPWISSLDGLSEDLEVLEIKVAGAEVLKAAETGQLPAQHSRQLSLWNAEKFCSGGLVHPKYYPQVQWHLMVTGGKCAHFVVADVKSIKGKETFLDIAVTIVLPDPEFHLSMQKAAIEFMEQVKTLTAPPATDDDYEFMEDATILAAGKKLEANRASADYADVRKELVTLMEDIKHPRWVIGKFFAVKKKDGVWTFFYDETLDELSDAGSTSVSHNGATARASDSSDNSSKDSSEVRHAG